MGSCFGGQPKDPKDREVTQEVHQDAVKDKSVKKLLLLGAGGSGKSTLFKQLQNIHGSGFASRDRRTIRGQIYEQIIEAMKIMITKCEEFYEDQNDNKWKLQEENESSADYILNTRQQTQLTDDVAKHIGILWRDAAIQSIFEIRNKICVPDSTGKFLNELERLVKPDYEPTNEDLLLVRYRTTGMAEKDFEIEGTIFKICDVGGQRNERRKWIHFFDNVTAVIFVASLSSYDEVPFEDETANSMIESLEVFNEHCNSHWFKDTAFILFLNKSDVFSEKIKKVPINVCFPNYDGAQEYQPSLDYIKDQFETLNQNPQERQLYTHVTCATNTDNIQKVFSDVQHIVIDWSLKRSGLI